RILVPLSLVSEIFLEPMVRIRFIIEELHLDEPSSLVEMLCFRERAVSLQSQDHHSPRRGLRRQSFQQPPPQSKAAHVRSHPHPLYLSNPCVNVKLECPASHRCSQ